MKNRKKVLTALLAIGALFAVSMYEACRKGEMGERKYWWQVQESERISEVYYADINGDNKGDILVKRKNGYLELYLQTDGGIYQELYANFSEKLKVLKIEQNKLEQDLIEQRNEILKEARQTLDFSRIGEGSAN